MQLELGTDIRDKLLAYLDLLTRWNKTYNLTAVREPRQMVSRHLLDSLTLLPYANGATAADLGTGAGLPGLVLAMCKPTQIWTLVDSNGKKTRFLRAAVRTLELDNVRVEQARVEETQGTFDLITARAFASLANMLAWGGDLLADDGRWLAMKGQLDAAELAAIPSTFRYRIHPLHVPELDGERHLVLLEKSTEKNTHASS